MAEVQIGMAIVGTLNAMAINSMRNTLHQIRDIFNPEGEEAEAFDNIDTLMFASEAINAGIAIYGGISIVRGLVSKLPGAINTLKNVDWSRIVKMRLGLGSVAQKVASRLVVEKSARGVVTVFDPASGSRISGMAGKNELFVMNIYVSPELRKKGVSVELYRKLIQVSGGNKIRGVRGTPAGPNADALWAGELAKAPRVRALEELGFGNHSTDDVSYILSER